MGVTKAWVVGPKGGRYYVTGTGAKVYGKDALEAAASDRMTEARALGAGKSAGPHTTQYREGPTATAVSGRQAFAAEKADPALGMLGRARQKLIELKERLSRPISFSGQPADAHPNALPVGRTWVDHVEGIAPRPEEGGSMAKHFPEAHFDERGKIVGNPGSPTMERATIHEAIKASFGDHVTPSASPSAIVTIGGPKVDAPNAVRCDLHAVMEKLPEWRELADGKTSARDGAAVLHEEAAHVMKQIRDEAIADHKDIVVGCTGADAAKTTAFIDRLHAQGYHVQVMMADVDGEEAGKRAEQRSERTGHWESATQAEQRADKAAANFSTLSRAADSFTLVDNNAAKPRIVATSDKVVDREYVDAVNEVSPRGRGQEKLSVSARQRMDMAVMM